MYLYNKDDLAGPLSAWLLKTSRLFPFIAYNMTYKYNYHYHRGWLKQKKKKKTIVNFQAHMHKAPCYHASHACTSA